MFEFIGVDGLPLIVSSILFGSLGLFIPSDYEKQEMFGGKARMYSIQSWLYLYKNCTRSTLILSLTIIAQALLLLFIWMIAWLGVLVAFGNYPIVKNELQVITFLGMTIMLISKYIRYLLFKHIVS